MISIYNIYMSPVVVQLLILAFFSLFPLSVICMVVCTRNEQDDDFHEIELVLPQTIHNDGI